MWTLGVASLSIAAGLQVFFAASYLSDTTSLCPAWGFAILPAVVGAFFVLFAVQPYWNERKCPTVAEALSSLFALSLGIVLIGGTVSTYYHVLGECTVAARTWTPTLVWLAVGFGILGVFFLLPVLWHKDYGLGSLCLTCCALAVAPKCAQNSALPHDYRQLYSISLSFLSFIALASCILMHAGYLLMPLIFIIVGLVFFVLASAIVMYKHHGENAPLFVAGIVVALGHALSALLIATSGGITFTTVSTSLLPSWATLLSVGLLSSCLLCKPTHLSSNPIGEESDNADIVFRA